MKKFAIVLQDHEGKVSLDILLANTMMEAIEKTNAYYNRPGRFGHTILSVVEIPNRTPGA